MYLSALILLVCSFGTISLASETDLKIISNSLSNMTSFKLRFPPKVNLEELEKMVDNFNTRKITTNLNEFVDKLLRNMDQSAICNAFDPYFLPDIEESFLTAHITLSEGTLCGIGKMHRYGNTLMSYSTNTRRLSLSVEVEFELLMVNYDYQVKLILIKPSGGLQVDLHEFRFKVAFDFDFNTYQASIADCSILDSGFIILKFSGSVLNEIISIISRFVSAVLQPVIKAILNLVINNVLINVIESVNSSIDHILHPTYETIESVMAIMHYVLY